MEIGTNTLLELVTVIIIFLALTLLGKLIYNKLKNRFGNSIDMYEVLPEEEVHTLIQVFYLKCERILRPLQVGDEFHKKRVIIM